MPRKTEKQSEITIVAVGDVIISRPKPEEAFDKVLDQMKSCTFSCCNFEIPLSEKGERRAGKWITLRAAPEMIKGFAHAGFKVVSLATNHAMDFGPEAMLESIDLIESVGILHVGAGKNKEEAWRPAFFTEGGKRFAYLGFATESFPGYAAHAKKPGIAEIRQSCLYGPTCVDPEDLEAMKSAIRAAKKEADFVIQALHWGISQSRSLTASQRTLGRAAIDAGAGLVIGHHPHILQGMEVYKGALILYSLGNFVFDNELDFLGPATQETILAKVKLSGNRVKEAILLPAWIEKGQPQFLDKTHEKNHEILDTLRRLSAERKTKLFVKDGIGYIRVGR